MAETQSEMYGGSEDASSLCEEERVRKLFQACDGDGDGYIDSQDLRSMCRELNLEHSLDELMRELGADENGRVSFDEFLRCRLALRPEIDALRGAGRTGGGGGGAVGGGSNGVGGAAGAACAGPSREAAPGTRCPRASASGGAPAAARQNSVGNGGNGGGVVVPSSAAAAAAPTRSAVSVATVTTLAAAAASHQQQQRHRATPEYLPTGSDHSLGAASGGKHESWEFDSGARDLSPEPHALQKLVEAAGGSLGAGSSSGMFELANKLHLAALTSLKGEILELSNRLHTVTQERDVLEDQLAKLQIEKHRMVSEVEQKAEVQSQRYEERITELHSVIAELRRSLNRHRSAVIHEEEDVASENDEADRIQDTAYSTANLADGSDVHESNSLVDEAGAEPAVQEGAINATRSCELIGAQSEADAEVVAAHEVGTLTPPGSFCGDDARCPEGQEAEAEDCNEQRRVAREATIAHHHHFRDRQMPSSVLARSLAEELALACGSGSPATSSCMPDLTRSKKADSGSRIDSPECCAGPRCASAGSLAVVPRDDMPVCKVAERVTLRKMDPQITGSQLTSLGVSNTPVAESLVSELRAADAAELSRGGELAARHEVEREQLSARLEHARAQNRVLALALEESRAQSERLSLLVGKYESNATALRLALGFSDCAIEAYDVLVALLESELGLLLASCRTLGLASFGLHTDDVNMEGLDKASLLKQARDNRYIAESVARNVLARLETVVVGMPAAPWDDFSHAASEGEWGQVEEKRLRDHIVRLKTERASVRGTVLELESCHVEPPGACVTLADACKLDLETAVLMQELMAVREERAELRARLFLLEKDKAAQELRIGAQDLQLQQLQAQLQELQLTSVQQWSSLSDQEQSSQGEEASRREAKLRERMQGLVATLEKVSKNSEMRHQQSADLINDLKHANSALLQTLDRSKKKYQSRIKKLEQRMLDMAEKHAHEVRTLRQRVADLENEVASAGRQNISSLGINAHSSTASETSL